MKAIIPSNRRPTKKERIHELISNGEYSDEDIAKIVGTTIPNVWKEKSTLRKSGVLVRHRVERSDRTLFVTSGAQAVYGTQSKAAIAEYHELLDIPPIDSDGMKKLYSAIITGKKPAEIIAEHGFHPAVVETEYARSQKFHHDMLSKRIISEVLLMKTSKKADDLIFKYYQQGYISDDDLIELLKEYMLTMHQLGATTTPFQMGQIF
ncbi:MAG: hypothetical protein WBZ36_27200 [Candidatus Nitrosopolaris sp.]